MTSRRLSFLLILSLVFVAACAGNAYRHAALLDDPMEYQRFLQSHPNGPYADKARADLERWRAFELAKKENTVEAYRKFIELYPEGETARRAGKSIKALESLDQARQAISQNRKDEARKFLEAGVSADPDNAAVLTAAGTMALEQSMPDAASAWLGAAVQLDPKDYRARTLLVAALLKSGKIPEGIEEARALLESRPDDIATRKILGDIFNSSGLYDSAALVLEDAARLSKYDPEIVLPAARAQLNAGNPAGALQLLTRIPQDNKLNDDAILIKGECYLAAGDDRRAHENFTEYISNRPDDPQGYYRDGEALERMGRWREAIAQYERAIVLDPGNSAYIWRMAVASLISGDRERAAKQFAVYLNMKPDSPRADMARRVVAGQSPGFEGVPWGTEAGAFSKTAKNVKCGSASGENICCEIQPGQFNGFKGKRCFVFKGGRLAEVRFEAQIGDTDNLKKIDPLIRELKSRYNGPISQQPRVSNTLTPEGSVTISEIAWDNPDGIVVLTVKCSNKDTGESACDLRITWAPG